MVAMQAIRHVRGLFAGASFFRQRKRTESFHTLSLYTKYNPCSRIMASTALNADVLLSQVRPFSSLTALFRRRNGVKVGIADSSAPAWDDDSQKSTEAKDMFSDSTSEQLQLERFIPLTRQVLIKALAGDDSMLAPKERQHLQRFVAALDAFISQRFYTQLEDLKLLYDKLDPDKDTINTGQATRKELLDDEYLLFQKLENLLYKANYVHIPRSKLWQLLHTYNAWEGIKVSVNPSSYDVLRIWTRGRTVKVLSSSLQRLQHAVGKRIWKDYYRPSDDFYTRVFVGVRSKADKKLHLKVFKEVPCNQLEYLLPGGTIMMSNFDKGFLASGMFLGGIAVILKLFSVASNFKLDWAWIGLACAAVTGAKGWVGYKNKKNRYLAKISSTLYFKNVSNNRGVLTLLTDRAQDEEFKECLLAYLFLLSPRNRRGLPGTPFTTEQPQFDDARSLKSRIEKWLHKHFQFDNLSFDVDDALVQLDSMGLLLRSAHGSLSVVNMDDALAILPKPSPTFTGTKGDSVEVLHHHDDYHKNHQGWK